MVNLNEINLLGIDVGFSKSRPTTGIAWSTGYAIDASRTHADWDRRQLHIPTGNSFSVIAIDGPVTSEGIDDSYQRLCERIFIRDAFQTRCKPGLSHIGYGKDLRKAASATVLQVKHLADQALFAEQVRPGLAIVEAFPNAFLGVLLPEDVFQGTRATKRKKFDWLYDHAVERKVLHDLLAFLAWDNQGLLQRIESERDHEKRAAWICLLTAACAASGRYETVGDEAGGWFWLPPIDLWATWAFDAIARNRHALAVQ